MTSDLNPRLTSQEVADAVFPIAKFGQGYDLLEVDAFLDAVVAAMQDLEATVASLQEQVARLEGRQ
ncbi:MAG: DivIVA domain-containing protein [Bifidobacteriaceae bacterium]|jgi:DivIVA domain-containing protein|nr:DivIVA domain-containing protein [Bifidobacteriaceae bacterium]